MTMKGRIIKTIVIVMMIAIVGFGTFMTARYNLWMNAPKYEDQKNFSKQKGVVSETSFVTNEMRVFVHRKAGDRPTAQIFDRENGRTYNLYDDGSIDFNIL